MKFSQAAPGVATGEGVSPAISWTNVPAGTQSFVLNMRDMDVARNKTTDDQAHWVVWNIPATATGLPEGVPKGAQLADGSYQFSATGQMYRGPGAGANGPKHHYMFELFALDTMVDVPPAADAFESRANVMKAIQGHVLGRRSTAGCSSDRSRPSACPLFLFLLDAAALTSRCARREGRVSRQG